MPKKEEKIINIDVNAKVNAKNIAPSINMGWYHKLAISQKKLLLSYVIWFVVHLLLLVSGKGEKHFFRGYIKHRVFPIMHI